METQDYSLGLEDELPSSAGANAIKIYERFFFYGIDLGQDTHEKEIFY